MIYWPSKPAPDRRLYGLDWGPVISRLPVAKVVSSSWSRLRGTATADLDSVDADGQRVYVRISGGDANEVSVFRNTVTFDNDLVWSTDVYLKVRA